MNNRGLEHSFCAAVAQHGEQIYFFVHEPGLSDWGGCCFQEGLFGLWEAHRTFDAGKGDFSTYAGECIKSRIQIHLQKRRVPWLIDRHLLQMLENGVAADSLNMRERKNHDPLSDTRMKFTVNQWKWLYGHVLLKDSLMNDHGQEAG
ncbi:sigma factor [Lentibacillus juripiscarius]|uniref:Sigma factor n=1 Tax=Lentibacillus juripiscarius TaxID=257446 RepID=A0ABW5V5M8_9BACI